MARKVMENAMVAHVWAQGNQDEGRSNNGQFYFVGPVLYSYGSHFVVGVIDAQGRHWLNTDGYSPTTAKHKSYARRAVRTAFHVPSLTGIYRAIQDIGQRDRRDWVKRELTAYLATHWGAFPADSEAGAILWRAISPRGSWPKERARREAKAAASAKRAAAMTRRLLADQVRTVAALPLDTVRLRMIESISRANDYSRERVAKDAVSYYADAHRAAKPGSKAKAACWQRVKLAREIAARLCRHTGDKVAKRRGAIATLRRIWLGDYGGQATPLAYAVAERDAIHAATGASCPKPLRAKAEARLAELDARIAVLEAEREAERYAKEQADREAWQAGERASYTSLRDERGGALLRAINVELDGCTVKAGELETSLGVRVPLRHAVRVFAFVRDCRAAGRRWVSSDRRDVHGDARHGPSHIRVGHFEVNAIHASGDFVAGCHNINWPEIERLARKLGVWDCPATALVGEEDAADAS